MARFPFPMPRSNRPRRHGPHRVGLVGAIALLIAALAGGLSQCQGAPANHTSGPTAKPAARSAALRVSDKPPERYEAIDAPAITARDEVRGIWDTLRRVANGPPFPYRQDGVVFQNRENRLAKRESGWWREYTVETPGSSDRGARRLVVGTDGEVWYSPDHYRTFVRLLP